MLRVAGCPFAESCKRIVAYNINECYPKYVSIKIRQKKKTMYMYDNSEKYIKLWSVKFLI